MTMIQYIYDFSDINVVQLKKITELDSVKYVKDVLSETMLSVNSNPDCNKAAIDLNSTEYLLEKEMISRGINLTISHTFQNCSPIIIANFSFSINSSSIYIESLNFRLPNEFIFDDQLLPNTIGYKAYYFDGGSQPTADPSIALTEYSDSNYASTNVSDSKYFMLSVSSGSRTQAYHKYRRFTFDLSSYDPLKIKAIQYCYEGYYTNNRDPLDGSSTIYYYSSPAGWVYDQQETTGDDTFCKTFTSGFDQIIDDNGIFQFGVDINAVPALDEDGNPIGPSATTEYNNFVNLTVSKLTSG